MHRLLAILILMLQPLAFARGYERAPAAAAACKPASSCCGTDCCCSTDSGACECAIESPQTPVTPSPAPTTAPAPTTPRFYLPPPSLLFTLPQANLPPQAPNALPARTQSGDSHARSLARLCVWRT